MAETVDSTQMLRYVISTDVRNGCCLALTIASVSSTIERFTLVVKDRGVRCHQIREAGQQGCPGRRPDLT